MDALFIGTRARPEDRAIDPTSLLTFALDDIRYALPLEKVERVIRAAAVTPLPKAPAIVLGILDLQGGVIPVFNVRRRFGLPERDLLPEDQFVIARAGGRTVALAVDEATDVLAGGPPISPEAIHGGTEYLSGVIRTEGGLVLIHDLESFLSSEEETSLAAALDQAKA